MDRSIGNILVGLAVTVLLAGASLPARADYKGGHLVYVQMRGAPDTAGRAIGSIAIYNSRDGGKRCYNVTNRSWGGTRSGFIADDIKTNFYVTNKWWFAIYAYNAQNCPSNQKLYERSWLPSSDNNKYWYARM